MDSSSEIDLIEQLADEFAERQQRGEKPTVDEYAQRYPELASEIREVLPALVMMEQVVPVSEDLKEAAPSDRQTLQLETLGEYRILREIGRGGMGIVYEAEQESLRRRVALKVLPKQNSADERSLERFQREARAAARMHHTNIVPVFDVDQADDWVFYAMQLIQGQGLDLVVEDLRRLRSEHASLKLSGTNRPGSSRRKNEPDAPSIAASLIQGKFQQEDLAGDATSAIGSSLDPVNALPVTSDSEALRAYAETVEHQGGSSVSAVLPGKSQISTAETDRRGYFLSVAQIGLQAADALAYAHARGIIHRDIKPSNLLLDAAGTVWVTDFGLAKTGDDGMTHTGDILGTIRYMSPERFRGQCDNRADIYSLGLTLYELLVLKPAFSSPDRFRLIEIVTKSEPEIPRSLDSRIPRDLETIVLKCIDKDARRRYQSADELAEDLQRFVDDEPIKARRISLAERFARWSRRNRALAASLSTVACLVVAGMIGSMVAAGYFRQQQQKATAASQEAERAREIQEELRLAADVEKQQALESRAAALEAERIALAAQAETRRSLYFAQIQMANAAFAAGDPERQQELLDNWRTADSTTDLRGFEWYYLLSQQQQDHQVLHGHTDDVRAIAWHPDGGRIASAGKDQTIRIWDAGLQRSSRTIRGHLANLYGLDWSRDGKRLASAGTDGVVKIWDGETGQELRKLDGHQGPVFDVAWNPDGKRLATASWDRTVRVWDAATGEELMLLKHETPERYWCVEWNPDGKRLAAGSFERSIHVWDTETQEQQAVHLGHGGKVLSLAWHQDGHWLASGGIKGELFVWEVGRPEPIRKLIGHGTIDNVNQVAWSPTEADQLATFGGDASIRLWDVKTGTNTASLFGHANWIHSGCWSPDGQRIASGSIDQTVRLWTISKAGDDPGPDGHVRRTVTLGWSPDASRYATGSRGNTVRIWRSSDQKLLHVLTDDEESLEYTRIVVFSPDGRQLASGGVDGMVRVWDVQTGQLLHRFARHGVNPFSPKNRGVISLAWHPDRRLLASGGSDAIIRIWDVVAGHQLTELSTGSTYALDFSPDGDYLATGHWRDRPVMLWETATWNRVATLDGGDVMMRSVEFSPDGARLAVAGGLSQDTNDPLSRDKGLIRVWDLGKALQTEDVAPEIEIIRHGNRIGQVSWSPDNERLASVSVSGSAQLWDVSGSGGGIGRELLRFDSVKNWDTFICFSPDGSRLAIASPIRGVKMVDAFAGYAREKSPQLLTLLQARIAAGTASADDYRVQAEIDTVRGEWDKAAKSYFDFFRITGDRQWKVGSVWVVGTFPMDSNSQLTPETLVVGNDFQPDQPVTAAGSSRHWQRIDVDPSVPLDFGQLFGRHDETTACAVFRVFSPVDQRVGILLGDDDKHRLWLNGELVSEASQAGPLILDEYVIPVRLSPGWNTLLAQVTNIAGSHGLQLRISDDAIELAEAFERNDLFDEALRTWDLAIQAQPENRSLLLNRAATRWHQGDSQGANEDFAAFITGRENDAYALEQRARVYLDLGRVRDGLPEYNRAVQLDPESVAVRSRCMTQMLQWNAPVEAAEHLDVLIELTPDDPLFHFERAPLYLINGDEPGYRRFCSQLLAQWHETTSQMAASRLAWTCLLRPANEDELAICVRLGELASEFEGHPQSYLRVRVGDGLLKYRQGVLAKSQGDEDKSHKYLEQAQKVLEAAVNELATDLNRRTYRFRLTQARAILAATLHQMGNDVEAREHLKLAASELSEFPLENDQGMLDIYQARLLVDEASRTIDRPAYEQRKQADGLLEKGEQSAAKDVIVNALAQTPSLLEDYRKVIEKHGLDEVVWIDVLTKAIDQSPAPLELIEARARQYVIGERYREAGLDYAQSISATPDDLNRWMRTAALLALAGDHAGYRECCTSIITSYDSREDTWPVGNLLRSCLLLPDVIDPSLLPIDFTVQYLRSGRTDLGGGPFPYAAGSLATYRIGDFDTSINFAGQAIQLARTNGDANLFQQIKILVLPVQAMAEFRQHGRSEPARKILDDHKVEMNRIIDRYPDGKIVGRSLPNKDISLMNHVLIGEVLRREAEQLISESTPAAP